MRIVLRVAESAAADTNVFKAVRKMVLASGLPYEPAAINPNWPRLAYGPEPAPGQRAEREYVDIYLREARSEEQVRGQLLQAAPAGLELLQVARVPYALPSVQNLAAAVRYRVKGDFSPWNLPGRKIEDWVVEAEKKTVLVQVPSGEMREKNIAPCLMEASTVSEQEVALTLVRVNGQWVPPQWVIGAWLGVAVPAQQDPFTERGIIFIRQEICWKDTQGALHPI
ncbi:MAG: DUF2344 domain-containing protein [Elusimicrobiaceae bacterium]|nr:DUF2344 domain-containing protein [Elusimicrobiaceae bacterium]